MFHELVPNTLAAAFQSVFNCYCFVLVFPKVYSASGFDGQTYRAVFQGAKHKRYDTALIV